MEIKNSALRTRVIVIVSAMGFIFGAHKYVSTPGGVNERTVSKAPSDDERRSPGKAAGLRTTVVPGISLKTADGETVEIRAPSKPQLERAWLQSTTRLKYLDHCEQARNCAGFDESFAFSYDLDVRRQQAQEVRDFTRVALAWQRRNGGVVPEEAQKIARYFLSSGNDDVKEAALGLIGHAPLTSENVRASFMAVETSASAPLMKQLLKSPMASACHDEANTAACASLIKHTMQVGGENLQKEFACHSLDLMTTRTAPLFAAYEKRQDPRSTKRLCMKLNREEFERLQAGS